MWLRSSHHEGSQLGRLRTTASSGDIDSVLQRLKVQASLSCKEETQNRLRVARKQEQGVQKSGWHVSVRESLGILTLLYPLEKHFWCCVDGYLGASLQASVPLASLA